jgi:MFS family permease
MGLQAAFMGLGGVLFLSAGGSLAESSWRYPFLIYLFAWLLLPLIVTCIYEPRRVNPVTPQGGNQPTTNASTPTKLLILIYGVTTLSQIIFYLVPVQLPFYLRSLTNASASQSGMALALCTLFSAFASMGYGRVKARLDFVSILPVIFFLMGIGYIQIGLAGSYALILIGLAIAGLALGLLMPNMTVWVSTTVPDAVRGRALGGLSTSLFLGQFLSPIVTQPVSQTFGLGVTYASCGTLLLVLGVSFIAMKRQVTAFTATASRTP